jgi:hypothetical protein
MTQSCDDTPNTSDDPTWTDTWYWNTIDVDTQTVVWAHVSWLPAFGRGQHVVASVGPKGVRRLRADVDDPFRSELLEISIEEPWTAARLVCGALEWDLSWRAFHPEIDFGNLLHAGEEVQLSHYEGGGRGVGTVSGRTFSGPGFRDRSFGPRNLRNFGRHCMIGMIGIDRDTFLTVNIMTTKECQLGDPPNVVLGCSWTDGAATVYDSNVIVKRRRDATPAVFTFPDGIEVCLDPMESFGQTYFVLDPNSVPTTDDSTDPVYELRDMYLAASSPQLGRLAGWYEEGALWINSP